MLRVKMFKIQVSILIYASDNFQSDSLGQHMPFVQS